MPGASATPSRGLLEVEVPEARSHLRSVGDGRSFDWVSTVAADEAQGLLNRVPGARAALRGLLQRAAAGTLRSSDTKRMKIIERCPLLYEMRLDDVSPRLRLYYIEIGDEGGLWFVGLMLAEKPPGTVAEQRAEQNEQALQAYGRWQRSPWAGRSL